MRFETKEDVKKWFRRLALAKKELKARIDLYSDFVDDCVSLGKLDDDLSRITGDTYGNSLRDVGFYRDRILACKQRCNKILKDWERISGCLDGNEVLVVTEKYLKGTSWDAMPFEVYFSRRQCYRLIDSAAEKLVGRSVGGEAYEEV